MKKWILIAVGVVVLIFLIVSLVETDESKIKKQLSLLEETVSKDKDDGIYTGLSKAETLADIFTSDCIIEPGRPLRVMRNLNKLQELYKVAFVHIKTLDIDFLDITIKVDAEKRTAVSSMTATVKSEKFEGQLQAREIECRWKETEDGWKITSLKEVKAIE